MMFKFRAAMIITLAIADGASARRRHGNRNGNRRSSSSDSSSSSSSSSSNNNNAGIIFGRGQDIIFEDEDTEGFELPTLALVNITCAAEFSCNPRRGGKSSSSSDDEPAIEGVRVCRTRFNPLTRESNTKPICVSTDKAWASDVCGCCGQDCPEESDYIDNGCDNGDLVTSTRRNLRGRGRRGRHRRRRNKEVVCREVYDSFTGEVENKTISIRAEKGLEGDVCGCCDDVCPDNFSDKKFDKNLAFVNATCKEIITCDFPGRGRSSSSSSSSDDDEDTGLFLCRSFFNPQDGKLLITGSVCIPSDRALETDVCGCCDGTECPATPDDGFADEDEQLLEILTVLEDP